MKKNIMIINADREAAQIVKDNLACPSTNILCVSSMHEALLSFMDKEFCLVILDACLSAEDDHKLLKVMRKARTTPKDVSTFEMANLYLLSLAEIVSARLRADGVKVRVVAINRIPETERFRGFLLFFEEY